MGEVTTPLVVQVWEAGLREYPDHDCADFLLNGIHQGLRIGIAIQG